MHRYKLLTFYYLLVTRRQPYVKINSVKRNIWISLFILPFIALLGVQPARSAPAAQAAAQATIAPSIFIQSPREGQALQGIEIIEGKIRGEGFISGKISFSYSDSQDPTWFYIADIEPVAADSSQVSFKVNWDTSQITDGDYNLRVVAEYQNASAIFELIPKLRIRNYSPVETSTPAPIVDDESPEVTPSPTAEPVLKNTSTALPLNPVVIKSDGLSRALLGSGIFVALLFIAGGLYWFIKHRPDN